MYSFIFFTFTHAYTGLLNSWFMILDNTEKHQMHCWYFSLRLVRHIISVGTQELFLSINWFALHFTHLADKSDLQCIQAIYIYIISMCVPWELNPWPFALLTQCSTTEPQEQEQEHWAWYSWCFISSCWASACFCIADRRNTNMYCFLWQIYSAVAEGMMFYLSFEFKSELRKNSKWTVIRERMSRFFWIKCMTQQVIYLYQNLYFIVLQCNICDPLCEIKAKVSKSNL